MYKDQCLGENVLTYFVSVHTESFPLLQEKKKKEYSVYSRNM